MIFSESDGLNYPNFAASKSDLTTVPTLPAMRSHRAGYDKAVNQPMKAANMETDQPSNEQESPIRPIALGVALLAGFIAAVLRVVPHPPNFSSVGALGIFGGARLRAWHAYVLPLGIMIGSDFCLWVLTGFDAKYSLGHLSRAYVYSAFMIYVLIGRCLCKRNSLRSVVFAALLGGLQFFIVTNFCSWLFQPLEAGYEQLPDVYRYSRDLHGLLTCFALALPFYQGELPFVSHPFMLFTDLRLSLLWTCVGDVVFSTAYFLMYAKLTKSRAATASIASARGIS
jgi:hypothetical protein